MDVDAANIRVHEATAEVLATVQEALRAIDLDLTMQRAARIALEGEVRELRDEVHALAAWQRDHDKFAGVDHDSGHSVKVDAP